jgi:hypothetical protein
MHHLIIKHAQTPTRSSTNREWFVQCNQPLELSAFDRLRRCCGRLIRLFTKVSIFPYCLIIYLLSITNPIIVTIFILEICMIKTSLHFISAHKDFEYSVVILRSKLQVFLF